MRYLYLLIAAIFLTVVSASAQAPIITSAAPVVNQGATFNFTANAAGTWSCAGTDSTGAGSACLGSIVAGTGVYTAPAAAVAQHSYGGFQLLPNNSVFNTRVDSLPLRGDSATLMAATGTVTLRYENDFTTNYANGSTPLAPMSFFYTAGNNGNFQIPAYPNINIESGWFSAIVNYSNTDHHLLVTDSTSGALQEQYQYYPACTTTAASVNGSNVATVTCSTNPLVNGFLAGQSACVGTFSGADTYFNVCPVTLSAVSTTGISYPLPHAAASASTNGSVSKNVQGGTCSTAGACNSQSGIRYLNSDYRLPNAQGGSVDAAGLYIMPLVLGLQEFENAVLTGGTIKHALRMTLSNNLICSSSLANACAGNAVGTRHIWPATAEAFAGGGIIPYGLRFRLKSSFNQSTFSAGAQVLLTQLKQYGLILADGGTNWAMNPEGTKWPPEYQAYLTEIQSAGIQGAANFEVVDESGLLVAANQTCPTPLNCSLSTHNRETVTFTRTSDSATASVDVVLQGVTVGMASNQLYFQAGAPAQQLTAFVNGSATKTTTWTMDSPVGTLTSGGLYTPPATDGTFANEAQGAGGSPTVTYFIEDKNITATGGVNATAQMGTSAEWIMYMVALKSTAAPNTPVHTNIGGYGTCSNTCTDGFSGNAAIGSLGVIAVYENTDATATISSTSFACGTMTLDSNSPKRGATTSMWLYTVQITSGTCGGGSVGITFNHSVHAGILSTAYPNLAASNVVDCSAAGTGTGYVLNSGNCTTGNANDAIVGFAFALASEILNPGGNYTNITATSVADPTVSSQLKLFVLPAGTMRIISASGVLGGNCGPRAFPCTPYVDINANAWAAQTGDDGGTSYWNGGSWPGTPDIYLYQVPYRSGGSDLRFDIFVPNGAYQITGKFAGAEGAVVGETFMNLEAQGIVSYSNVDIVAAAGGPRLPKDYVLPATVTDNKLSFVLRNVGGGAGANPNNPYITALQIVRTGVAVATTLTPGMKVTSGTSLK